MYYLISVILREPDILYEADPLPDLLAMWQQHGVPNAMILEKVDVQDLGLYYASAMALMPNQMRQKDITRGEDDGFLFSIPERNSDAPDDAQDETGGHRMLLTIMHGDDSQIESLLDHSENTIREKLPDAGEVIFVFPLAHVRGFPGLS